ncbi:hypothetical protein [Desulfopila sp. IMCC35008]|uniref:hypothetical protein n=1 Tax=Desulfopila sp. IMCC35008 TaxID=2653858 RepID=UPI0013D15F58|nr:hypothetical protein [Desulfopila sp. IMCC35008]
MKNRAIVLSFLSLILFPFHMVYGDNNQLADEVMAIHDEAMAKMTHMHELKLKLQDLQEKQGPSDQITTAIEDLQNAHKGMMQWMRAYKAPKTPQELEAAETYLLQEKEKIKKVSEAINSSIAGSEKILTQ